jgi:tetratricopeptide (TPR) repeat protein
MFNPRVSRTRRIKTIVIFISIAVLAGCAGTPPPPESVPETMPDALDAEVVMLEAEAMAQKEQFEEAATILEEFVEREQTNTAAMRLLANVYAALGLKDKSTETWARIAALAPNDPDAAYEMGIDMARNGDWQSLRSKMLFLESSGKMESRHYLLLGEADLELGYKSEAELNLKKAEGETRAHYLLGELYYGRGKLGKAETEFETVLRSNPDNYSAHLHLGWLSYKKEEKKRALEHYRSAVRLNPADPLSALSLAGLLEKMDQRGEAIEQYSDALSLPGIPREEKKKAYNSLSRLLVEAKLYPRAKDVIGRGLEEFPDSGGLYYQWGIMLLSKGSKEEAKEKLRKSAADPVWRETALQRIHTIR